MRWRSGTKEIGSQSLAANRSQGSTPHAREGMALLGSGLLGIPARGVRGRLVASHVLVELREATSERAMIVFRDFGDIQIQSRSRERRLVLPPQPGGQELDGETGHLRRRGVR